MRQKRDSDGNTIGSLHYNPFLDTHVYKVQFQYGSISNYAANIISENPYSQIDPDGNDFLLLNYILDHRSTDKTVNPIDAFEGDPAERKYKNMTAGWEILVEWYDKT